MKDNPRQPKMARGEDRGDRWRADVLSMADAPSPPANTGWCSFAEKHVSPNFWPGHAGQPVKAVVMHIAQGSYEAAVNWLTDRASNASAHFLIAKDGRIAQFVSIQDSAWANGLTYANGQWLTPSEPRVPAYPSWTGLIPEVNPNYYTLSIEHEGVYTEKWTPAMYAANLQLLQWIRDQTALNYTLHDTLIGHHELNSATRKNCPGPNVEWERMALDLTRLASLPRVAMIQGANKFGVPLNDQTALARFALANKMGIPLTDEFVFYYQDKKYYGQVWSLGVVYAKDGDFDHVYISTG
jgi:N-acetyl-anhydromuramyl-L-alanine amidase AmpD